jgi:hypothetical protein
LIRPGPVTGWLVAASYAGFAMVVAYARTTGGVLASCGCFGTPDTPATALHLVIDLGLCGAASTVALVGPSRTLLELLAGQPAHGVPLVLAAGLCTYLTYLAVSTLADLRAARALTAISFRREPMSAGGSPP